MGMFPPSLERLIAALCAALMLFYAATVPVKAADQIEHTSAFMTSHDHEGSGDFALDIVHCSTDAHAAHHDAAPDTNDQPGDQRTGGHHHHHGDTGPNLIVAETDTGFGMAPSDSLHGIRKELPIAGMRSVGPERPPRMISLNV